MKAPSLPAGVFKPYAGVKTAVLVFRRPPEGSMPSVKKVWFYEIANDGYDPDKVTGGGRAETPEKNEIPDLMSRWEEYRKSGFKNPPGPEAGALLEPGSEMPKCWWASVKTLAANDFNLAARRYKPQVAEQAPDDDPAELIREALAIERDIASGLEKLLQNMEAGE